MLGVGALGQLALGQFPGAQVVTPTKPTPKGWFGGWDKPRRRIPIELLREVLKEQGNPWAEEIGEAVEAVEVIAKTTKSPKLRKTLKTAIEHIEERASVPLGWDYPLDMLRIINRLSRTTQAIKYAEMLIAYFEDEEEEEELVLLTYEDF